MIVDVHAHLGRWYYPTQQLSAADIMAGMARLGVDLSILSSSLGVVYDFREGNRELAAAIDGCQQLRGYVVVNLNYLPESLEELARYLEPGCANAPFVGIKVHPALSRHRYDTADALAFTRAAAVYGVPILVHTFSPALESPWNVVPAALANPGVPIILGHMGGDAWWEGIRAAQQASNLYLEICATYSDPDKVRAAIDAVGVERVLFGTDSTLFDAAHMLGAVADAGLTTGEQELVLGENARRLFNLQLPGN